MCFKKHFWIIILLVVGVSLYGQGIRSGKSYLQIKTEPEIVETEEIVKTQPEIKILSPQLDSRSLFETSESEIPLIGIISSSSKVESVVVNSEFVDVTEAGQFATRLELFPGENTIIVGALDENKIYTEQRFKIQYTVKKISLAEKINKESKYYALIIGINNYSDPALRSLENPILDAEQLFDVLTTKYTFEKDNVQFLPDAKREDIIYALDNLARDVTPEDNLLIFYAGHGNFDREANIGYWLPSNAKRITTADWFGNSQLVDFLKKINSKHTLLITDACFSGSIFTARAAFSDAPLAIEKLYELPSRKAMTSGTLTEVPDRSSFAKYLIDRLSSNQEQYYVAEQLFSSLRIAVINNSDAIPQYGEIKNVGDQGGDFIFIRK